MPSTPHSKSRSLYASNETHELRTGQPQFSNGVTVDYYTPDLLQKSEAFVWLTTHHRIYNPCHHTKWERGVDNEVHTLYIPYGGTFAKKEFVFTTLYLADVCSGLFPSISGLVSLDDYFNQSSANTEVNKRIGSMKYADVFGGFDLAVFLVELADLKSTFKGIKKFANRLVKRLSQRSAALNKAERAAAKLAGRKPRLTNTFPQTLGDLADLISSAYLEFAFGLGAFIRDVISAYKVFVSMFRSMEKFEKEQGKLVSTRNRLPFSMPLPATSMTSYSLRGHTLTLKAEYSWVVEPYTCVTVVYKYWSHMFSLMFGKCLFVAQRLGLNNIGGILWAIIPFSFVLDWFIPIGNYLQKTAVPILDVNVTIKGVGCGAGFRLQRLYSYEEVGSFDPIVFFTETFSEYRRYSVNLDALPETLPFGGLTFRKILTGSALIWQCLLRGTSKKGR